MILQNMHPLKKEFINSLNNTKIKFQTEKYYQVNIYQNII